MSCCWSRSKVKRIRMYICFISSGTSTQYGSSMNFVRGAGENLCFFDSFDTAESRDRPSVFWLVFFFHYALSPIRIVGGRESQRGRNIRGNPKLFPRACTSDTTRGWLAGVSATTTWISCRNYTRQAKDFRVQSPGVPYVVPSSCSIIIISFSFEFEFLNSPPSLRFPS